MTSHGTKAAPVKIETANVLAFNTITASSGTPTTAMALPTALTVSPIHSNRKFRCRSRPPTLRGVRVTSGPTACTF
jgi:hypothetical protein